MKTILSTFLICILSVPSLFAQNPKFPIVKGFGGIYDVDKVSELPDPSLKYKIVIDVKGGDKLEDNLNASLNNIARMLNLHGLGGVKADNIEVIAIIHSKATPTVLSDKSYQEKFQIDNPNTKLIKALAKSNVKVFVCGQSLLARGFKESKLHPDVKVSISALTILTTYQLKGYALLTF